MKNIFEFLYYCLYRMFALIKRVGVKDENLASLFYSILLFTNILTLSLFFKFPATARLYRVAFPLNTG